MMTEPMAFPMGNPTHGGYNGMTLRDYFARQIIAAIITSRDGHTPTAWAQAAYDVTDAMLAARQEPSA
jgi:hypothetical protein